MATASASTEWTRRWRAANPELAAEKNRADASRWYYRHLEQAHERMRMWQQAHPDRHIRRAYGLTQADYDALLIAQGGVCAACGQPERAMRAGLALRLSVDHVHGTGRVRGLLCTRCNRGIGNFDDDPARLEAAARYLRSHL